MLVEFIIVLLFSITAKFSAFLLLNDEYYSSFFGIIAALGINFYLEFRKSRSFLAVFSPQGLLIFLFIGYQFLTSIFYYMDANGYFYFVKRYAANFNAIEGATAVIEDGFWATLGMIAGQKLLYKRKQFTTGYDLGKIGLGYVITAAVIFSALSFLPFLTGLKTIILSGLQLLALYLLFKDLKVNGRINRVYLLICIYFMILSFLSGMKEGIVMITLNMFLFSLYFFPRRRVLIIILFIPLFSLFQYLIVFTNYMRQRVWYGGADARTSALAFEVKEEKTDIDEDNWIFLTGRLSEMDMFIKYRSYINTTKEYMTDEMTTAALYSPVPSFLRPDESSIDKTAMNRAIKTGAFIKSHDKDYTSAKPSTYPDAYMYYGFAGVVLVFLVLGMLSEIAFQTACRFFPNLEIASMIIFPAAFWVLFRGGPFENIFSSLFWGFISLVVFRVILKKYLRKYYARQTHNPVV
jgi:hypothetical protein